MLKLDEYTPRLLQLMRAKGGAAATRMQHLLNTVNEVIYQFFLKVAHKNLFADMSSNLNACHCSSSVLTKKGMWL